MQTSLIMRRAARARVLTAPGLFALLTGACNDSGTANDIADAATDTAAHASDGSTSPSADVLSTLDVAGTPAFGSIIIDSKTVPFSASSCNLEARTSASWVPGLSSTHFSLQNHQLASPGDPQRTTIAFNIPLGQAGGPIQGTTDLHLYYGGDRYWSLEKKTAHANNQDPNYPPSGLIFDYEITDVPVLSQLGDEERFNLTVKLSRSTPVTLYPIENPDDSPIEVGPHSFQFTCFVERPVTVR